MNDEKKDFAEIMTHVYSKALPLITGSIFVFVLVFAFLANLNSAVDASVYVTAITTSGAIWGSSIIWYSKKRTRETAYELKIRLYKESVQSRLYFNREMAKLMKKYNLTENDLNKIDSLGESDELMQTAIDSTVAAADAAEAEADEADTLETFNI